MAEKFVRTIRDFLQSLVFERSDANWIDFLPIITKQYNNRVHTSTKLTPVQGSLKKNEVYIYQNLLDNWKKIKQKSQVDDLLRTADLKKTFAKSDTTNWSYKLFKITEIIHDTIPSYHIDNLKERYNETLSKKTELTLKENKDLLRKIKLSEIEVSWSI